MKKILFLITFLVSLKSFATQNILGGTGVWTVSANWSLGTVPTSIDGDTTVLNSSSPSCSIQTNVSCNHLYCAGYTGTINFSGSYTLAVYGNIVFSSGMTVVNSGSSAITENANASITTNKFIINSLFYITNSYVVTFNDSFKISGGFYVYANSVLNGSPIIMSGNFSSAYSSCGSLSVTSGSSLLIIRGNSSGSISFTAGCSSIISNNVIIDAGSNTIAMASFGYSGGTFKYIGGTITGTPTFIIDGSCALDFGNTVKTAIPLNVVFSAAFTGTVTLNSNLYFSGTLTAGNSYIINNDTLECTGTSFTGVGLSGTSIFVLAPGSSTTMSLIGSSSSAAYGNTLIINGAGTINFTSSSPAYYYIHNSAIYYVAGTITNANTNGNLIVQGNCTLNTGSSINWSLIGTFNNSNDTLNLFSTLYANTIEVATSSSGQSSSLTFLGNAGFNASNVYLYTEGEPSTGYESLVLLSGNTYICSSSFQSIGWQTHHNIVSGIGGIATFTFSGSSHYSSFCDATNINGSSGNPIYSYYGNITNTSNWVSLTPATGQYALPFIH